MRPAGQAESAESRIWRAWTGFGGEGARVFLLREKWTLRLEKIPEIFVASVEMGG
jgi:hypothetical protein